MKHIKKITLSAILIALSIVLDIIFKQITFTTTMGFPYYAIPVVIGSIVLGPLYGALIGASSDVISFFMFPQGTFSFWFIIAPTLWGLIPGFFVKSKANIWWLAIVLLTTHIIATAFNTLAMYQIGLWQLALSSLSLRIMLLPVNVVIITFLVFNINKRLEPIYDIYLNSSSLKKEVDN